MWNSTWRLVFIYFISSLAWLLISDKLISMLALSVKGDEVYFQIGKDVLFSILSSYLLYLTVTFHKNMLSKSEEQYKQLFFANPNPMWIYSKKTLRFVEVNNAAVQHYGYNREEFRKMTILDIRPKEFHKKVVQAAKERPENYHISGNWNHQKKNGKIITALITSHGIEFNGKERVIVMAQDITLNIKHETALKKSYEIEKKLREELEENIVLIKKAGEEKQKLAEVIDRINNMVVITDPFGNIIWVNNAFTSFTGYAINEVAGKSVEVLHGPKTDPKLQHQIMESLQKKEFLSFEALNYTKKGLEYWVEFNLCAIYNEENEIERYISIQNVITERKKREEKIQAYNAALKKLAWTNSHAVRKPVASILGLVELCKHTNQVDEIKKLQSLINVCSLELDGLIREMEREISNYETASLKN